MYWRATLNPSNWFNLNIMSLLQKLCHQAKKTLPPKVSLKQIIPCNFPSKTCNLPNKIALSVNNNCLAVALAVDFDIFFFFWFMVFK